EEVERIGGSRALIITGNTLANKTDLVKRLQGILGNRCAGVFAETKQHVLKQSVLAAVEQAKSCGADTLISFGGGSPNDTMKMVIHYFVEEGRESPR
ncbi:MAG: iron-containing alcohol dehydrogenase, partial [Akkermansiaceae bacterium]|nr:iron-containing alcohol dehydrogenase [Akkermansiaceae bacterium]